MLFQIFMQMNQNPNSHIDPVSHLSNNYGNKWGVIWAKGGDSCLRTLTRIKYYIFHAGGPITHWKVQSP